MDGLRRDIKAAVRGLLKSPGFTATAVLCLALGIGVNAAAFNFANELMLRPLPHVDSDGLVRIYLSYENGLDWGSLSYRDAEDLAALPAFESVTLDALTAFNLARSGSDNQRAWGSLVSRNYFEGQGIQLAMGRPFRDADRAVASDDQTVVISHGLYTGYFGSASDIIGSALSINGQPFEIVGVAPEGFVGLNRGIGNELWVPFEAREVLGGDPLTDRGNRTAFAIARLADGYTIESASAAANNAMQALQAAEPGHWRGESYTVIPESAGRFHPLYRGPFLAFILMVSVIVALVLLVACANVAGLLLARGATRAREMSLRQALGASRMTLVRQLLTESVLLALIAGAVGLVVAVVTTRTIARLSPTPAELPVVADLSVDGRVLTFTLLCSLITSILFGLMPALQASRTDLVSALKQRSSWLGGRQGRLRKALVVAQLALSLVLMAAALVFTSGLSKAELIDPGFRVDGVSMVAVDLEQNGYAAAEEPIFLAALHNRLEARPEVSRATHSWTTPFSLFRGSNTVWPSGQVLPDGQSPPILDFNIVAPNYFDFFEIPIEEGRPFGEVDAWDGKPVVIINRALAERFWPGEPATGKTLEVSGKVREVVGVTATGKYVTLGEEPTGYFYLPHSQVAHGSMNLFVTGNATPEVLQTVLREEVGAADPELAVYAGRTMQAQMGMALLPARLGAILLGLFGALALTIAAIGLYGVLAFAVARSTREIGLRIALGAQNKDVLSWVLRRGMGLVAVGLGAGAVTVVAAGRLLERFAYGASALDPLVLLGAITTLAAAGALAVGRFGPKAPPGCGS